MQNLRWKIITIVSILIIFTLVGVYPILAAWKHLPSPGWLQEKQLKLGLDVEGGVHLVLRVQTDDALRIATETAMARLRADVQSRNSMVAEMDVVSPTQFSTQGIAAAQVAVVRV